MPTWPTRGTHARAVTGAAATRRPHQQTSELCAARDVEAQGGRDLPEHGLRPGARVVGQCSGVARHAQPQVRLLHQQQLRPAQGAYDVQVGRPVHGQDARGDGDGGEERHGRRGQGGSRRLRRLVQDPRPRPRPPPLRHRAVHKQARAALCGARVDGQREDDPRDARLRPGAGDPALLPPRRLGPARRDRDEGLRPGRRHWPGTRARGARARGARTRERRAYLRAGDSVELPAAHARVEDRARPRDGQHRRAQARAVHLPIGAPLRAGACHVDADPTRPRPRPSAAPSRHAPARPRRSSPRRACPPA